MRMQCDCKDENRRGLVLQLAHVAAVDAAQNLLECAVHNQDAGLIVKAQILLQVALNRSVSLMDHVDYVDVEDSVVLLKYKPDLPSCKPEDCDTCFYRNICSSESVEASLRRARQVVKDAKTMLEWLVMRRRCRKASDNAEVLWDGFGEAG